MDALMSRYWVWSVLVVAIAITIVVFVRYWQQWRSLYMRRRVQRLLETFQESVGTFQESVEPPAWAKISPHHLRWVPDFAVVQFEDGGVGYKTDAQRAARILVATRHTKIWYPEDAWVELIKAPSELAKAYVEGAGSAD